MEDGGLLLSKSVAARKMDVGMEMRDLENETEITLRRVRDRKLWNTEAH